MPLLLPRTGTAPAYVSAVVADTPAGYWRLSEASSTVVPATAVAHVGPSGLYIGSPVLNQPGLLENTSGTAARFDGVNDYVSIADQASLDFTNQITIESWSKPDSIPTSGNFRSIASKPGSYGIQYNGPLLEFWVETVPGTKQRLQAPAGVTVAGGTYHIVGTYDGDMQRLYVNGVEVVNRASSGNAVNTSNSFLIGSYEALGEYYAGIIDEVAIYARTLSASRVVEHYNSSRNPAPSVPVNNSHMLLGVM